MRKQYLVLGGLTLLVLGATTFRGTAGSLLYAAGLLGGHAQAQGLPYPPVITPSGMDGVGGLNQRYIAPGDAFAYEFTLEQHGTQMYHSHADEMVQIGLGTMGFFVIHPKERTEKIDRDFAIFLNEWFVQPGSAN